MVRKSKWIEDTYPQEPLQEAAHRALRGRLNLVWHYLLLAGVKGHDDVENVHQLRVSSRRATAAMQTFEALLPPQRAKWISKQLKRIRRAAGTARDLDVLTARLERLAEQQPDGPYARLQGWASQERLQAQKPLKKIRRKVVRKGFPRHQRGLLKRVRLRSDADKLARPDLLYAGRNALRPLVDEFFRAAEGNLNDDAALHALRIQGKHLRYAMEIFSGAFGPQLRNDIYPRIEALQEQLGEINDHVTAQQHLRDWLEQTDESAHLEALEQMIAQEQDALRDSRRKFLDSWTSERSGDLRRRFAELLGDQRAAG